MQGGLYGSRFRLLVALMKFGYCRKGLGQVWFSGLLLLVLKCRLIEATCACSVSRVNGAETWQDCLMFFMLDKTPRLV